MSSVDVVVPCYRYGHFLDTCVRSVLAQVGTVVRVLIIDDGSPDNTSDVAAALAAEDPRVTWVRHAANQGHIATYNEGLEWACADYLLVLSADDYLLPGALAQSTRLMDEHPDVGFTFGKAIATSRRAVLTPAPRGTAEPSWHILDGRTFICRSGARNLVPTPTAVIRTRLQKRLGGYRRELPHSADMEMWLRLAAHAPVGFVDAYQAVYRQHGDNMSLSYYADGGFLDLRQREAAIECFLATCPTAHDRDDLRRRLSRSLATFAVGLASEAFNAGRLELSTRLSSYALDVCPGITGSWSWAKLACKRRAPSLWSTVQPLLNRTRAALSHLGDLARVMSRRPSTHALRVIDD